jgi:hypothetical protein
MPPINSAGSLNHRQQPMNGWLAILFMWSAVFIGFSLATLARSFLIDNPATVSLCSIGHPHDIYSSCQGLPAYVTASFCLYVLFLTQAQPKKRV